MIKRYELDQYGELYEKDNGDIVLWNEMLLEFISYLDDKNLKDENKLYFVERLLGRK
jgi:hypothetical protein